MINYTERLFVLMEDIVARVPTLSFIDMRKTLVFARPGRSGSEGAYATCHCVSLPPSEPGYYFWRDRKSGCLTRRSEWFVTKSPDVRVDGHDISYMISFALPRFCDQALSKSRKQVHYAGAPNWVAKLDTIVHELYHIDPERPGIRRMEKADGSYAANCHGQQFFENVVGMVNHYLQSGPDSRVYDFLQYDFAQLQTRYGVVAGTAFRSFPSYPQRYPEPLRPQPAAADDGGCKVEALKPLRIPTTFTEDDLVMREFMPQASRRLTRADKTHAA